MNNLTYIIITTTDITQPMLDVCMQNSTDALRNSSDGRSVLKWEGSDPAIFDAYTKYNHDEILVELEDSEWQQTIP